MVAMKRLQGESKENPEESAKNKIQAINTYTLLVITYAALILSWTKEEIKDTDTKKRKVLVCTLSGQKESEP